VVPPYIIRGCGRDPGRRSIQQEGDTPALVCLTTVQPAERPSPTKMHVVHACASPDRRAASGMGMPPVRCTPAPPVLQCMLHVACMRCTGGVQYAWCVLAP
jgi:hypothetical protein